MSVLPSNVSPKYLLFLGFRHSGLISLAFYNSTKMVIRKSIVDQDNKIKGTRFIEDVWEAMAIGVYCSLHS